MGKRTANDKEKYNNGHHTKTIRSLQIIENNNRFGEDSKARRDQKIKKQRKRSNISETSNEKLYINRSVNAHNGTVNFPSDYIQQLKESYTERSYLGKPEYKCKHCEAIFWFNERNKSMTRHNTHEPVYSNCCKNGKIRIPKYREPPSYLNELLYQKMDSRSILSK